MPSIILEHVKGKDISRKIAEAVRFDPEGNYRVSVQIEDEELSEVASLIEVAEILSKRARERGLTSETLESILNDDE